MNRRAFLLILPWAPLATSPAAPAAPSAPAKNLLENGSFQGKLDPWHFHLTEKYGIKIEPKLADGAVHFTGLTEMRPKYLYLTQWVDIRKGRKYKLSFDLKAASGTTGKFTVAVERPQFAVFDPSATDIEQMPLLQIRDFSASDWQTHTRVFTGVFESDNADARRMPERKLKERWEKQRKHLEKAPCWLSFNLGAVAGAVSIRNVSIVESSE